MSQQINLYEERLRPSSELCTGRNVGFALALVLAALALLGVVTNSAAERSAAELKGLQTEVAAAQQTLGVVAKAQSERKVSAGLQAEIDNVKAQLASRNAVMAMLDSAPLGNSKGFSEVMSGFSRHASGGLWLTGFSVGQGGQEIEIRGRLFDPGKLPIYVQRLSEEPEFKGRRFAALDMRSVDPSPAKPGADAAARPPAAASPALPRYLEFVLRSEMSAEPAAAAGGKK